MADQQDIPLLEKTTAWLLESQTPSIRYFTLTQIKGYPEVHPEVSAARRSISSSAPAARILAAQDAGGFWVNARHIYSPKYRSTHWTMMLLIELGLDPQNDGLQKGADFLLAYLQENQPQWLRRQEAGFGCFWGNWLRYQLYCGKGGDTRVAQVIDFICAELMHGGECRYNSGLPCAWSVVRGLYGLALIPQEARDERICRALQAGIRFLIEEHDLLKANYPADQKTHPLWESLSFPIFYHADRLFVLRVLKELGVLGHPKVQPSLDWLRKKQTQAGIWRGGSPLQDRTRPFLAKPDGVERWITLHTLEVLA